MAFSLGSVSTSTSGRCSRGTKGAGIELSLGLMTDRAPKWMFYVVGADGANSDVRRQRFPNLNPPQYTGNAAIFGGTWVGNVSLPTLQRFLDAGGITALGPHRRVVFCTTMRFRENPVLAAARLGLEVGQISAKDYMMWAVFFRDSRFGDPASALLDPTTLHNIALDEIDLFHQAFRTLVEHSEPTDAILMPIRAMPHLRKQRASRVALIGDTIDAIPPFGAHGGNTSLKDWQVLAAALSGSTASSARSAIAAYESDLLVYGYKAVRDAKAMMRLSTPPLRPRLSRRPRRSLSNTRRS